MTRYLNILFGFLALAIFFCCATPGHPTGGPKDEIPPVPVNTSPKNFSTLFNAKTIVVKFDENIELKNLNQQYTVSPPMAKKPDISANNRTLTIRLQDSLRQNATYAISFGNALADFNEGNILPNYQYVFSTGSTIDSFGVAGKVLNAHTLQPEKDVSVVLLSKLEDLGSKADRPAYIAKADSDGHFHFSYLHEGCYFLAAIKDGNSDWVYDSLQEDVAFLQTCVSPKSLNKPAFPDSCSQADSVLILDSIAKFYQAYQLLMFKQDLPQSVNKAEFTANATIRIEFGNPAQQVSFRFLQPEIEPEKFRIRWDANRQIADIFLTELGLKNLLLYVEDSAFSDTLKLLNTKFEEKISPFKTTLTYGSELAFFDTLKLSFSAPIREIKQSEHVFWLYSETDSIPLTYYTFNESRTQIVFETPLKQNTNYELMVLDSLLIDYFEQTNADTLRFRFKTTAPENYARLDVILKNKPDGACLLQILNEKLTVVEQRAMLSNQTSFTTLKPAKYLLRLIVDQNNNQRWDAGNLREKRLPDPVFMLPKTLSLEADWEYEEEWEL